MRKHTTMTTGRASLCALGEYLRRHCFFAPLREQVQIPQKTVRYRPIEKLLDALGGILCGAKTIAQNNVTIRTDRAVQRAFGRTGCAEQSTIARTLRACTAENVTQLEQVSWYYLKRYGPRPTTASTTRCCGSMSTSRPCPLACRRRAASAPGWGAIGVRRAGKPYALQPVSTAKFSMRRCSGAKRRRCQHSKLRCGRWKRVWDGPASAEHRSSSAWTGALGPPRC